MALETWYTPFYQSPFPVLRVIPDPDEHCALAVIATARSGKYELRFKTVLGYRVESIAHLPIGRWEKEGSAEAGASCVLWIDSPWLKEFRTGGRGERRYRAEGGLQHFAIFGNDFILEILSPDEPKIVKIDGEKEIVVRM